MGAASLSKATVSLRWRRFQLTAAQLPIQAVHWPSSQARRSFIAAPSRAIRQELPVAQFLVGTTPTCTSITARFQVMSHWVRVGLTQLARPVTSTWTLLQ